MLTEHQFSRLFRWFVTATQRHAKSPPSGLQQSILNLSVLNPTVHWTGISQDYVSFWQQLIRLLWKWYGLSKHPNSTAATEEPAGRRTVYQAENAGW